MADIAHTYTDKQIAKLDKQIQAIYAEAEKDIQQKMDAFNAKYKVKEQKYQQQVNSGQMTQKEFDRWKKGQVFQGEQWQAKKDQILDTIHHSNEIATNMINGETQNIFKTNANYMSYDIEHGAGINFGFGIYDSNTVSKLIKDDPQLLPKWKIDEPKDYKWSQKKLNNAITQGIIQGESLDKIANRISKNLSSQNKNKMKTFARTAMTGAQNSGRQMQLENAKKMGIELMKEWMATLDSHTRDSHADIDGEQVEVDKKFSNGLMYPGEPGGAPAEVYNCRCTMVSELKKYPSVYNRYNNETGERIKNMSYRDWEKAKKSGKSMAPYSINKMAISDLFKGLSQNGAYTKIHDVDPAMSNQFYKELQAMGKAYPGGANPAQVWKDYLDNNLPDGVSEKKLEKIMAEYKDKASKISVAPGDVFKPIKAPKVEPKVKTTTPDEKWLKKNIKVDKIAKSSAKDGDATVQEMIKQLNKTSDAYKKNYVQTFKKIEVVNYDDGRSYYRNSVKIVNINLDTKMRECKNYENPLHVMFHEMGHAIDYNAGSNGARLSGTQVFKDAFKKDIEGLNKKISSDLGKLNSLRFDDESRGLQDVFSSLPYLNEKGEFKGKIDSGASYIRHNWAHSADYWRRNNDPAVDARSELFAHLSAAQCSKKQQEYMKEYFPNTFNAFTELIENSKFNK